MVEARKISPVVVIAGGLGLALAGALVVYAIARAAPGVPPEPPPGLANLYGIITDAETGEPIAGVQGTVYQDYDTHTKDYNFTTDSSGYYLIDNMLFDVDRTLMVIYADGYVTYTNERVSISEGDNQLNVRMVPE